MSGSRKKLLLAVTANGGAARGSICSSCLRQLSKRTYASAATATIESTEQPPMEHLKPQRARSQATPAAYRQEYSVQCGIVLSRPPQITRDLTPFEKAFFLYQRRLNERLTLPFTRYHYFSRNTPVFKEWQRKLKERLTPAHEIGRYNAYSSEAWNDEVLIGAPESETQHQVDAMLAEASANGAAKKEGETSSGEIIEQPLPRLTVADEKSDQRSLDRLLQQSLYLMVQTEDNRWIFPTGSIVGAEGLRDAAERILLQNAGPDMNTFFVGNAPIGLYNYNYQKKLKDDQNKVETCGEKVFFMKARIAAGQVNLQGNNHGWKDYMWLSKSEIESKTTRQYWSDVRRMLPRR